MVGTVRVRRARSPICSAEPLQRMYQSRALSPVQMNRANSSLSSGGSRSSGRRLMIKPVGLSINSIAGGRETYEERETGRAMESSRKASLKNAI